uniref:Protein TsetseEP domain-containing protein n=1 Tax=Anopheles farauti TaxID=69004 RepID=A0A1Y9HB59_9DIPT
MMTKWLLVLGAFGSIVLYGASVECFLVEYQDELANISSLVVRDVSGSWAENNQLNGMLNRMILTEVAERTIEMRRRDEYIADLLREERDSLSDACVQFLEQYYTFYRSTWGVDLSNCVRYAYQDLDYDTFARFRPQASSAQRIIKTATYQVVRTLSMSDIFDWVKIREKLDEELQSYRATWSSYETTLREELDRHGDIASGTMGVLEQCIERALVDQQVDIEVMEDDIQTNCDGMAKVANKAGK